ncbi:MAG TPA: cobyrinate a,c-diamide synthase [Candidatus Blautia faecigallinarum]|uniref:Cobyrinate a,c-diamide synthase n=1 Tax=Candidatus Blautia faecigallinarum TaxID=2838488 RepID=A0A9D2DRF9_9FIRM|nr:cobyrinate a,c-diamide synthase [Candidatus Blautia faecigallinarum]
MRLPRIMLSAGSSGSGKTLLTCGLLKALSDLGVKTASFKCGPDYIDPMFHSRVLGIPSRNLDTFFTGEKRTRYLLGKGAQNCDLAVMEGVMGYYDGLGGTTTKASAYDLARVTDTPVILIVNSKGMSVSLAAYIKGFLEYKEDSRIKGVILNQLSPMLYPRMKALLEEELGIQVLGYVPKLEDCVLESRHLGLLLPHEVKDLQEKLKKLSSVLKDTVDIQKIRKLAESAGELLLPENLKDEEEAFSFRLGERVRIGVARDEAFCFFYQDNFQLLQEMGAEMVWFSPLHDPCLPSDLDGLLFYGGYPELYAGALGENQSMLQSVRRAVKGGLPCMAECGGFMYLHGEMEGMDGGIYKMAGVLPGRVYRTPKLRRFGYVTLKQRKPVLGTEALGEIPAHEFHYFDSENCGESFRAQKPISSQAWECIHGTPSLMAGFPHLYYYAAPKVPRAFLTACAAYKQNLRKKAGCP